MLEDIGYVNQEGKSYVAVKSKTHILLNTTKVFFHFLSDVGHIGAGLCSS